MADARGGATWIVTWHTFKCPRRVARDADGQRRLWPTYVLGWWSIEVMPPHIIISLRGMLDELRRRR